jgi:hypothetical protein
MDGSVGRDRYRRTPTLPAHHQELFSCLEIDRRGKQERARYDDDSLHGPE